MKKQLPPEIWHRIMLFTSDPKPLSQTCRCLYIMCLNPMSISKWLMQQFESKAFFAALWYWNRELVWKQWIENMSDDERLTLWMPDRYKAYALIQYDKNWFEGCSKSKCRRCDAYGLKDASEMDQLWFEGHPDALSEVKEQCQIHIKERFCTLEIHQFNVCKNLVDSGVPFEKALPLLLRFAATNGHIRLLRYFLCLGTKKASQFVLDNNVFDELWVQSSYHNLARQLLGDALDKKQLLISFQLIKTSIMHGMRQMDWNRLVYILIENPTLSLAHLFMEENTRTKVDHAVITTKNSCIPFPFSRHRTREKYRLISNRMIETLSNGQIQEDEPLLAMACCESGREDLVRYLHSKNVTFNHFDNSCLFQAVVFGHCAVVDVLLYECNCNTSIYGNGRLVVFGILLVDHTLLLLAMVTSFISFVNEFICRRLQQGGPSILIFGFYDDKRWCIPDQVEDPFGLTSFTVWVFFTMIYVGLSTVVPLAPLLKGMFKVYLKKRRDRKVAPNPNLRDLEEQPIIVRSFSMDSNH